MVRRDVVRLVTPGTITEERLLEPGRPQALLAVQRLRVEGRIVFGLASVDISTGAVILGETDEAGLAPKSPAWSRARSSRRQSLLDDAGFARLVAETAIPAAPFGREGGDGAQHARRVAAFYGVETLEGFGAFSRAEVAACALALGYVERTQVGQRPDLAAPTRRARGGHMEIDAATRANLELTRTLAGERRGSLLATLDLTKTPAGARALAERLASPLTAPAAIDARLDAVAHFVADAGLRAALRGLLAAVPDFLRALARLALDRGGPRDLAALARGLARRRRPPRRCWRRRRRRRRSAAPTPRWRWPTAASARRSPPRSPTSRRSTSATAASSAPASAPNSTRRGACATTAAASSPRLQARYVEATGARQLQHQAQQFPRLFHRGAVRRSARRC